MVRFLHTADWQLGMTRRFLSEEAQARFSQDRFDAVRRLVALAQERQCAFVVVCGDVFESNQVDRRTVVRGLEALAESQVPIYLLPGNHDPLDAASLFRSRAFLETVPAHVHVLDSGEPVEVAPGIELVGAPWESKRPLTNLVAAFDELPTPGDGVVRVAAAHGGLDALAPRHDDPSTIELAGVEAALARGQYHFLALGDRHSVTRCGDTERVWYAGTPEPTAHDEVDPGQVLIVDVDRDAVRVEPVRVGSWSFTQREIELWGRGDVDSLGAWLSSVEGKERTAMRLVLRGTLRLGDKVELDRVVEEARDLFAGIEVWGRQRDLTVVPDDEDFADLQLTGFAAAAVEALRERAAGDDEDGFDARGALALLLRLAGRSA